MQLADSIDDQKTIAVLREVSNEELKHAGEFLKVLKKKTIEPDEEKRYTEGANEVDALWSKTHLR